MPPWSAATEYLRAAVKGTRRAAMLVPKPRKRRKIIPPLPPAELIHLEGELGPDERLALRALCLTADLFVLEDQPWLLAPVTPELVDTLAAFEAEAEDRENDLCDEAQADAEPSFGSGNDAELELEEADKEDGGDSEPDEDGTPASSAADLRWKPAPDHRSGGWIEVAKLKRRFGIRRAVKYW